MTSRDKKGIINAKGSDKMKNIKLEISYLTVLFMGLVSCAGGAIWLLLARNVINSKNIIGYGDYLTRGLEEIVFCAILHIILGVVMMVKGDK
jgi:hypothetical protein